MIARQTAHSSPAAASTAFPWCWGSCAGITCMGIFKKSLKVFLKLSSLDWAHVRRTKEQWENILWSEKLMFPLLFSLFNMSSHPKNKAVHQSMALSFKLNFWMQQWTSFNDNSFLKYAWAYVAISITVVCQFLMQCSLRAPRSQILTVVNIICQWLPLAFMHWYFPVLECFHIIMYCERAKFFAILHWKMFLLKWLAILSQSLGQSDEPWHKHWAFGGCSFIYPHLLPINLLISWIIQNGVTFQSYFASAPTFF